MTFACVVGDRDSPGDCVRREGAGAGDRRDCGDRHLGLEEEHRVQIRSVGTERSGVVETIPQHSKWLCCGLFWMMIRA